MSEMLALTILGMQKQQTEEDLRVCNEYSVRYGLVLSEQQIQEIVKQRFETLTNAGRVEFGEGILKKLIYAFADSPYITQDKYKDIILELMDSFYYFKNESKEKIPDDELISFMKKHFDTTCQGSLEYLNSTTLEDLCRKTRFGYEDKNGNNRLF